MVRSWERPDAIIGHHASSGGRGTILLAVGFAVLVLVAQMVLRVAGMPRINPVLAFGIAWVPILVVASFPGYVSPELSDGVWIFATLALAGVTVGAAAGWWFTGQVRRETAQPVARSDISAKPTQSIVRWHVSLTMILAAYAALQISSFAPLVAQFGGWGAVLSSAGGEFKYALTDSRNETIAAGIDASSALVAALGYALFLGHLSLFTGAILWRRNRRVLALVPLGIAGAYSLLSLQRTSFMMALLLFCFSIVAFGWLARPVVGAPRRERSRRRRAPLPTIIIAVGLVFVLLVPLQARNQNNGNATGLQSLAEYLLSGLLGLSARLPAGSLTPVPPPLESGLTSDVPGFGAHTFTGLFTLLRRFGIDVPNAPHALDYLPVKLGDTPYVTNTATALLDYWFDFGLLGVFLLPGTLAFVGAVASRRIVLGHASWVPAFALTSTALVWSFFVNAVLGDFRYLLLVVLGALLLRRLVPQELARPPIYSAIVNDSLSHRRV